MPPVVAGFVFTCHDRGRLSGPFRQALEGRVLHYAVGVTAQMVAFAEEPRWE